MFFDTVIFRYSFNLTLHRYFHRNIHTNQPFMQEHEAALKQLQLKSKELLKHEHLNLLSIDEVGL